MQIRFSTWLGSCVMSLLLLAASIPAVAGIPDPTNCTVPVPLVACPAGDAVSQVVVRDIGGFPVTSCAVTFDLSACPGVVLCPVQWPEVTYDPGTRRLSVTTDANGVADFRLKMGGTCPAGAVVSATGITLWSSIPVASPDQNADLLVSGADVVIASALLGSHDARADFDRDGTVTEGDIAWMDDMHGGHTCDNIVPARAATWGSVKILYR